MTSFARASVGVIALAAVGCSNRTATVAGRVAFQGKPVVFGSVTVIGADHIPRAGAIQPDSSYEIRGVPLGGAKVAVVSLAPPGAGPAPKGGRQPGDDQDKPPPPVATIDPEVVKKWFAIPPKYGDPKTSEIALDVKGGQPFDIDLK